MARKIDYSKPLSSDDRTYLQSRNEHDLIAQIDASQGVDPASQAGSTGQDPALVEIIDFMQSSDIHVQEGERVQDTVIRLITLATVVRAENEDQDPDADGDPSEDPEDEDPAPDYEQLSVEDLREELARRELSKSGNKAELIQRLQSDDEEG